MKGSQKLKKLSYKSIGYLKHNAPTILTYVGAAGVIGTAVSTAKATTKASKILEQAKDAKGEALTNLEKIKVAGPVYIPAILIGTATITCIFGANILNKKQQAGLLSAYALLDRSYKEYKIKVEELYGEDANGRITEEIAKDKYEEVDIQVDDKKELFYDEYSKRYFESTIEDVQRAEYRLNRNLVMRDYAYLNEWYEELGMEPLESGYKMGWSTGACMAMYWQPWIDFSHSEATLEDGTEYRIIYILGEPIPDFEEYC